MAAGRRRKGGGGGHEGPDERWLLTYADMITLLMALFIVMFAISSVNTSKFEALSKSLKEVSQGSIDGGESVLMTGGNPRDHEAPEVTPPVPAIAPLIQQEFNKEQKRREGAQGSENQEFERVKRELDAYAATHGLKSKLETQITRRGLVIR